MINTLSKKEGLPKMRVYLDNCCYNRPYDDQTQLRISLEAQAKIYIQEMIKNNKLQLAASYILLYENSKNPYEIKRKAIGKFIEENTLVYIDESYSEKVGKLALDIMASGIKSADAHHIASAIFAKCKYLLTTDDRLLKYTSEQIKIIDPITFVKQIGGFHND